MYVGAVCNRCFEWGCCNPDGICLECARGNDEYAVASAEPGLHSSWCLICGGDIDGGDECPRCWREISADTEPSWRERYVS